MSFERVESAAFEKGLRVALISVSDRHTLETDEVGRFCAQLLSARGFTVLERSVVPDSSVKIEFVLNHWLRDKDRDAVDVVILLGGTGVLAGARWRESRSTGGVLEIVRERLDFELPGFAQLFRSLSFQEIGAAAMRVDALLGGTGQQLVIVLPGSTRAVTLAVERLLGEELDHLVSDMRHERHAELDRGGE